MASTLYNFMYKHARVCGHREREQSRENGVTNDLWQLNPTTQLYVAHIRTHILRHDVILNAHMKNKGPTDLRLKNMGTITVHVTKGISLPG